MLSPALRQITLPLLTASLLAGCGGTKPADQPVSGGAPATSGTAAPSTSATPSAASPTRPVGDDPAAAIMAALDGVKSSRIHESYDFLPTSYQKDVDGVISQFAGKMDPDIWQQTVAVLKKGATVLKEKKDLILASPSLAGPAADAARQNWDGIVGFLGTLLASDLADLNKLKSADSRTFLQQTGNQLVSQALAIGAATGQNPFEKLQDVTATVVSREGDTAVVKLASKDNPEPEDVDFVKVDGKWLPKSLTENWPQQIADQRARIDEIDPAKIATIKEELLGQLKAVDATFDKILAAKSQEEFTTAYAPLTIQALFIGQTMNSIAAPPATPIEIRVIGELSDSEASDLTKELRNVADEPLNAETTVLPPEGGHTVIKLSGVKDVEAFSRRIGFAEVTKVDKAKRSIDLQLGGK